LVEGGWEWLNCFNHPKKLSLNSGFNPHYSFCPPFKLTRMTGTLNKDKKEDKGIEEKQ